MTPAQFNELQRQAEVIEQHEKWKKESQLIGELIDFQIYLFKQGLITNRDWEFEKLAKEFVKTKTHEL
jgi:hypothetical protein